MTNLEKYQGQQVVQDIVHFEGPPESDSDLNFIRPVLRRWYLALIIFVVVCAIGIPVAVYRTKTEYRATAAIRVAPIIPSVLFSDIDSERVMPMYTNFKNDQAKLIIQDQRVLQRVADALADSKLRLFEGEASSSQKPVDMVEVLRQAINARIITATPARNSELILISMRSKFVEEAKQVVDAFRNAYMAIEGSKSSQGGDQKLRLLENEHRIFANKLNQQREHIRQLAEEYGSVILTPRQNMMLQRVAMLQDLVTKIEADKLLLEIKMETLKKTKGKQLSPGNLLKIRHEFIDNDLRVQNLTQNIIQLEQNLIVAKQTLTSTNPQLQRHTELLESFKTNLEDRREALGKTFDESINEESTRSKEDQLFEAQVKLDGLIAHKEILQAKLDKEDAETIKLGRKQLDIQEEQEQLALTKEVYDTIRRRIQELEMERKRPARISIPYEVTSGVVENKRRKLMIAVIFAAMASGVSLAFLRDKIDLSLHTPEDVVKRVGVQIIGTTTCFDDTEKSLLPEQIVDDYQTICANLGLFNGEGIPKKLMVTSPGPREGKTTLAINLASSLAKTGKRVLLVDGDLRKPDVAKLLSIKQPKNGLQELILGKKLEEVVSSTTLSGLAVLTAKTCKPSEIYELIAQQHTFELINTISEKYDHIIIDSPPILIVSDSLLWAKMVDAAILTSFVNQTEGPDLKEAIKRLTQINVKVLGAVLNNVPPNHSYNSYAYRYASRHDTHKNKRKNREATLLLRGNPKGRFDNSSL